MEKSTEKLVQKMNEDKDFAEKILIQTEKEKVIELAKEEGIEITLANIDEVNEIIKEAMENLHDGELSEEELESVSGGTAALATAAVVTVSASAVISGAVTFVYPIVATAVSLITAERLTTFEP